MRWLGVDVGAVRKGFDVALVDEERLLALAGGLRCADVVALVARERPAVVGIDSPCACAPPGATSRADERALARAVCGIRWTPDERAVRTNRYYDWVVEGLRLHDALASGEAEILEVFPTASWTRWHVPRGSRSRTEWSRTALAARDLAGVPERTNQDQRDAIGAALTARAYSRGATERFGAIVVPRENPHLTGGGRPAPRRAAADRAARAGQPR